MFSIPIYVACQLVILEVNKSDNNDGFFPFPTTAVSVFLWQLFGALIFFIVVYTFNAQGQCCTAGRYSSRIIV